jgi:hypothetical protein
MSEKPETTPQDPPQRCHLCGLHHGPTCPSIGPGVIGGYSSIGRPAVMSAHQTTMGEAQAAAADAAWLRHLARNEPTNGRRDHMRAMADRIERREREVRFLRNKLVEAANAR